MVRRFRKPMSVPIAFKASKARARERGPRLVGVRFFRRRGVHGFSACVTTASLIVILVRTRANIARSHAVQECLRRWYSTRWNKVRPRARRRIVIVAPQTLTRFALLCRARRRCWAWTCTGCRESKRSHVRRAHRLIVGHEMSLIFRVRTGKGYFLGELLWKIEGCNVANAILINEWWSALNKRVLRVNIVSTEK